MRRLLCITPVVVMMCLATSTIGHRSASAVERINIADGPCAESTSTPRSNSIVPRPDGGYIVGGSFAFVGAQTGTVATVDAVTGVVDRDGAAFLGRAEVVLPDGSGGWFVAGSLSTVDAVSRTGVVHLGADGHLDLGFTATANGTVRALALDGSTLFVGGSFSTMNSTARKGLAAVDAATGVLSSFDPVVTTGSSSGTVRALAVDGSTLYVGGTFTDAGGSSRQNIAAIDTTTGTATSWNPGASDTVNALAASGGVLYAGGSFSQVNGSTNRSRAAAFDLSTGALTGWNPNVGGTTVSAIDVDNGVVYLGGSFALVNGGNAARSNAAAFDATTGAAASWDPSPNGDVFALDATPTAVYLGGSFTTVDAGAAPRRRAAAVDTDDGSVLAWDPTLGSTVTDIAVVGDAAMVVGEFNCVNLVARNGLAAIDRTGRLASWDPAPSGGANVTVLERVGDDLYVGGAFTSLGGVPHEAIGRVDISSGAVDSWDPGVASGGLVNDIAVDGDDVYLVGVFGSVGGTSRGHAASVSASSGALRAWDPQLDVAFTVAANWQPGRALALVDGLVYVGGDFTQVTGGATRRGVAVFDATGTLQSTDIQTNNAVTSFATSGDTLYIGGVFSTVLGTARARAAAVDVTTNTLLPWNPSPSSTVTGLTVDGSIVYLAGSFTSLGNVGVGGIVSRTGIGAVDDTVGIVATWNPSATTGSGTAAAVDGQRVYVAGNLVMARQHAVFRGNRSAIALFGATQSVSIGTATSSTVAGPTATFGDSVTDLATVVSFDGVTDPTGSVTFYVCSSPDTPPASCDDTTGAPISGPVPLDPGAALDGVATAALTGWMPPVGHHLVHAVYSGSTSHEPSAGTGTDDPFEVTRRTATIVYNGVLTATGAFNVSARVFPAACRSDISAVSFSADLDGDGSYETHVGDAPVRPTGAAGLRWNPGAGVHDIEMRIVGDQCTDAVGHAVVVVGGGGEAGTASVVYTGAQTRRLGLSYRTTGAHTVTGSVTWSADGVSRVTGSLNRVATVACAGVDVGSTCRNLVGVGTVYTWNPGTATWDVSSTGVPFVVALADGDGARRDRFRLRTLTVVVAGQVSSMLPANRGDVALD